MGEPLVQIGGHRATPSSSDTATARRSRRPDWLKIRLATPARYHKVRKLVEGLDLHTVCQEARCPNIYECWGQHGTATFMILGDVCTRSCGFCAVTSGRPSPGVDPLEPQHVAEAVAVMGLQHAVITSVDRDDLQDGGAECFRQVTERIHELGIGCAVELLTPDFRGVPDALDTVLSAQPEVFSHNMETVRRVFRRARPGSDFARSLGLLREAARRRDRGEHSARVKTGIMVGIGERPEEVFRTLEEIRAAGVDVMTLGQYMQPTPKHLSVDRWVHPDEFERYRRYALDLGFLHCEAGPLVRSSYHAHEHVGPEKSPSGGAAAAAPAPSSDTGVQGENWQPVAPSI